MVRAEFYVCTIMYVLCLRQSCYFSVLRLIFLRASSLLQSVCTIMRYFKFNLRPTMLRALKITYLVDLVVTSVTAAHEVFVLNLGLDKLFFWIFTCRCWRLWSWWQENERRDCTNKWCPIPSSYIKLTMKFEPFKLVYRLSTSSYLYHTSDPLFRLWVKYEG